MSVALLDVNVLVALTWPNHVHHRAAGAWFATGAGDGWATCSVTESGFVRVSSNRRVIPTAATPGEAVDVLRRLRRLSGHHFWHDDVSLADCDEVDVEALNGYRQVTDAHLVALAARRGGRLVTFDRSVAQMARSPESVETLSL